MTSNTPVVLLGDPDGLTIIDVSLEDGWGLTLSSDNITLKDFTVMSGGVNTAYAIHSEPGITGLTIEDVNVLNSSRSCIDLNGLTGPELNVIRNVKVSNSAIGFGLEMSSCASVWVENITSTDNGFGDIAIMESNYYEQNITGVSFNGQLDLEGPQGLGGGGVVVQVPIAEAPVGIGPDFAISMNAPGFQYFLEADGDGICDDDEVNCIGDLNEDGLRGAADILILLAGFGCSSDCGIADLNDDGLVAASDLLMAPSTFGLACPN